MDIILVIEPTESLYNAVTSSIESSSFRVEWAHDQAKAREFLVKNRVCSVVVNVDLHREEELTLIEMIRSNRRHHQAHIIAVSQHTNSEAICETMRAGADDYMSTPVQPNELRSRFAWAVTRTT